MLLVSLFFSCHTPTYGRNFVGQANHPDADDVGTDTSINPPSNFVVKNDGTGTENYLE